MSGSSQKRSQKKIRLRLDICRLAGRAGILTGLRLYIAEADKEVLDEFKSSLETEAGAVDDEVMAVCRTPLAVCVELIVGLSRLVDALQDLLGGQAV